MLLRHRCEALVQKTLHLDEYLQTLGHKLFRWQEKYLLALRETCLIPLSLCVEKLPESRAQWKSSTEAALAEL